MSEPQNVATDDTSQRGNGNIRINLVGFDKPMWTALAVAISMLSALYCFTASLELQRANFWLQRSEAFLEQLSEQGIHVPSDLLPHKEKRP